MKKKNIKSEKQKTPIQTLNQERRITLATKPQQ